MELALTVFGESVSVEDAILGIDWSATDLGHPSGWPQSLRSIVALILASGKPMFIVWGSARTLLYNDAYAHLLGARHPGALGTPYFSVWTDAQNDVAPLFDRLFGGTVIDLDDISISFDREEETPGTHFALSYTPIRDHGSKVVGLLCIHSETTDRMPGKVLQASDHKRLAQMFELAPSFVAVLSGPEHRIELANAGLLKMLGDRKIAGKTVKEALPDPAAHEFLNLLDQAFRTGERVVRTAARYAVETAGASEDERFLDFVLQPITDGVGQVNGIFVHGSDVTERVHAEAVLRDRQTHLHEENADLGRLVTERSAQLMAKEALIQTVYEHSSEYHMVVAQIRDGVFRLEEMNPAALKFYKAVREEVIGRTIDECLGPDEAAVINAHLTACLKSNAPHHYESVYAGNVIEGIASPLPAVRGIGRQIAVSARDVTERRNLQEQLRQSQKMEAVGQLTGGLAHDFNNLLSGISGSLELLKARKAQGRLTEIDRYITAAQGAAHRAAALTHRLLAFARRQTLDAKSTDVNRLVAGLGDLVRRTVGPAIHVATVEANDLWKALVDPNQLENALLNLCINARDAMPNGGELVIRTSNHSFDERTAAEYDLSPGRYLSLCVSDTGTGMSPEVMAKAFEPFFTTKPIGEGTGLGLSMLYGFARQSGGSVRIRSAMGQGTTVCVYLPRHVGDGDDTDRSIDTEKPLRMGHGETVLVVDDEPTVRMLVTDVLNDMGYKAIEAKDGVEGLRLLQSGLRIELLVTDVGLPGGVDGRQLVEAARAYRSDLRILFITGYADISPSGIGDAYAGVQTLTKPFAMQELAVRVSTLMGRM
ncbi:MAG: hybrid sensor histidine kinase/response regulator [Gammaproteobacteria bacterium]|nr:hybrid sensor histidine kinase/response regulator [Gammaproteobacteria bacterium]